MREKFLSFSLPLIGEEEINDVVDALRSGWLTSGPRVKQFEQEFSAAFQAPGALALNSATAGLQCGAEGAKHRARGRSDYDSDDVCSISQCHRTCRRDSCAGGCEPDTLNLQPDAVERRSHRIRKPSSPFIMRVIRSN